MNKNNSVVIPDKPWASSRSEILKNLHVYRDKGLDQVMVARRKKQFDSNSRGQSKATNAWKTLTIQFKVFIVLLLLMMILVLWVLGQWRAGAILLVITVLFVTFEFLVKKKNLSTRIGEASNLRARVRRDGETQEILAEKLVPGDIVLLQPGDVVAADLRLIEVSNLQTDESALTGDPVPVDKQIELLEATVPLIQQSNMAFKGTLVISGSGEGIVVALETDAAINKTATLADKANSNESITLPENRGV